MPRLDSEKSRAVYYQLTPAEFEKMMDDFNQEQAWMVEQLKSRACLDRAESSKSLKTDRELQATSELGIIACCVRAPVACWSVEHRCFKVRYEQISVIAVQVFGGNELADGWMRKPKVGLGHKAPCVLLSQPSGYSDVLDWLMRIEHGSCM
ncbi:antitoxin Xre/MbcA/ParS toxin-binding domain-containing protein [Pseudomonas trivialis]